MVAVIVVAVIVVAVIVVAVIVVVITDRMVTRVGWRSACGLLLAASDLCDPVDAGNTKAQQGGKAVRFHDIQWSSGGKLFARS